MNLIHGFFYFNFLKNFIPPSHYLLDGVPFQTAIAHKLKYRYFVRKD